jgi:hypothetical protein
VTADAPALETSARAHAASSLAAVLAGAATWGLSAASPLVAWPIDTSPLAARGSFVLAFGWVAAEVLTLAWLTRGASPARLGVSALVATAALAAIAVLRAPPSPPIIALVAAILLAGGSSAGALVGSRIQHPGHLGVVAVVSSVADIVSVFHESGPTAQLAESTPWLSLFAIGAPMLGTSDVPPLLGVGDVVMAALYATAAARFALTAFFGESENTKRKRRQAAAEGLRLLVIDGTASPPESALERDDCGGGRTEIGARN